MDGITALKLIREIEEKQIKHVPIIALTANSINGDRKDILMKEWIIILVSHLIKRN